MPLGVEAGEAFVAGEGVGEDTKIILERKGGEKEKKEGGGGMGKR
jgi:hypothetical protein